MTTQAGAQSLRKSVDLDEMISQARNVKTSSSTKQKTDDRFASIESNPFYSVIFDPALDPEQKKAALVKLRTFAGTKEENRERAKEYDLFKEFLQENREQMAREIIALTDTDTFAELQRTYQDINDALIQFEEDMNPLTNIVEAVYALRTDEGGSKVLDAFKEIKNDINRQVEIEAERAKAAQEFEVAKQSADAIQRKIAALSTEKSFFGFGGVKPEAAQQISSLKIDYDNTLVTLSEAEKRKIEAEQKTVAGSSTLPEHLQIAKEELKNMLNLSAGEHTERQKALVSSALGFIETSKDRIGSIREHLGGMDTQIDNLTDTNRHMSQIYAIMTEAEKAASLENRRIRENLLAQEETENLIQKQERETKLMDLDEYIQNVSQSTVDTQSTYADLASSSVRILTMKDATTQQIVKAREMHSRGVAGIADRLSTVLQAVSGAAISEAQQIANETHMNMVASTNRIAEKEAIRVAMGVNVTNEGLVRLAEDLESYGKITSIRTNEIRSGLEDMQANLKRIEEIRNSVQTAVRDAVGVTADVESETKKEHTGKIGIKSGGAPSPFKLGQRA